MNPSIPLTSLPATAHAVSQDGGSQGVSFAIPADSALAIMRQIIETGSVVRGWLGVEVRNLGTETAERLKLVSQSGVLVACEGGALHLLPASQSHVALGDPANGCAVLAGQIKYLAREARRRGLWPALYKCGARSALTARALGWAVMPISEEAWISPHAFSTDGAHHRQLRRKLKLARRNAVVVEQARLLPIAEMNRVALDGAARCGGERGFSMGRFEHSYVAGQRCYVAWSNGRLVAFATFHVAEDEWTLDLMRSARYSPDGTMHALVAEAIRDAKHQDVARLSLAAMPLAVPPALLRCLAGRREAQGLSRFKTSFAPNKGRLYLAAPSMPALILVGSDILLRIARPDCIGAPDPDESPQATGARRATAAATSIQHLDSMQ